MKSNDQPSLPAGALIVALVSGAFSGLGIATVLIVLGVNLIEATIFSLLGGVTIACFVWIERSLTAQIRQKDRALKVEVERRLESQDRLFSRSLACFVRFDAGTLIIDQASPGFLKMLRLPVDTDLRGERLEEILQVNPLKLESLVDSIKEGDGSAKQPKTEVRSKDGFAAQALVSGDYFPEEHMIQAAFLVPPINNAERVADLESNQKDLDRFRQGMYRRETRILELKEEVNGVCREAGLPKRYQTDLSSDDSSPDSQGEISSWKSNEKGGHFE